MGIYVREGKLDLAIVAGPRVNDPIWPSVGARTLASICTKAGLDVGMFGGSQLIVRGVIALPATGALVLVEDPQRRIHRIYARSVVRICMPSFLPNPFAGWYSEGLLPIPTAENFAKDRESMASFFWNPATAILGTGNRGLRFGSFLLESGLVSAVYCIETYAQWGAKRFAGWEVERRRFETAEGKIIEGTPSSLTQKSPVVWELKVIDAITSSEITFEVGKVVSAGPFLEITGVRAYPPGSLLFELEQTAKQRREDDVEGWVLEEERGRMLGSKISRLLVEELGIQRDEIERLNRRARSRLKRHVRHLENPFTPVYQGKWIASEDMKHMRLFTGVPKNAQKHRMIASIECFEDIPCSICHEVCPESAIGYRVALNESKCTGCGVCVVSCPSSAIVMLKESDDRSMSSLALPYVDGPQPFAIGDSRIMLNRRGETLGSGRINAVKAVKIDDSSDIEVMEKKIIYLDIPTHILWEARGIKKHRQLVEQAYLSTVSDFSQAVERKVEVTINGEKRLVRERIPVSTALYEVGQSRKTDMLGCGDGSCGLCEVHVDGIKTNACQTNIRRGMNMKLSLPRQISRTHAGGHMNVHGGNDDVICQCLEISRQEVLSKLKQGKLQSVEGVISLTHIGEGKCHGQICMDALRRLLVDQGIDATQWIDWRFPWSDWRLSRS
ncbi:MAG: (2Fe-2S)-binding protein [Bdellovibrionota bacterium]